MEVTLVGGSAAYRRQWGSSVIGETHGGRVAPPPALTGHLPREGGGVHNQPFSSAILAASARLRAFSFWIAEDR
jgi:hypothetical protein